MGLKAANNASAVTTEAIGPTDTSVTLSGNYTLFPTLGAGDYFIATLVSGQVNEIVKVTAIADGGTATIVRSQEGTSGASWPSGTTFANYWTAGQLATIYGATVESATINGSGHLLITLSGGTVIDAGQVGAPFSSTLAAVSLRF